MRFSPALFAAPRFLECCPSAPGARMLSPSGFFAPSGLFSSRAVCRKAVPP